MRKYWSLTCIFFKTIIGSSMTIKIRGKERGWLGIVLWAVIAICFVPLLFIAYTMMSVIFEVFHMAGHLPLAVGLVFNIGSILIFMFSLLAAPALFYFAKDVEYILPLPLKPGQIIGAKFTVALAFEYVISLALLGTMFVALREHLPTQVLTFNTIITFLTLPILPLVYSTAMVMVLMRVTRLGRNPDRYALFVGMLAIIISVGFSMYASHAFVIDADALMESLMGNHVAMTTLNTVFFGNGYAARAFGEVSIIGALPSQLVNVFISAGFVFIFFVIAGVLYFPGVIGLGESGAPSKKMTIEEISKNTKGQGKFRSYLIKELRLLFRNPVAFMNGVLGAFIIPIIMAISLVPLMRGGELTEVLDMINFQDPRTAAIVLAGMCAIGFVVGGMVSITCTSISREGRNLFIMKYLPIPYSTQLNAKATSGLVVLIPALLFMLIPLQIFFQAPFLLFLGGLLLTLPGAIFVNYMGLYIDLLKPKLTWDNEQAAVKQNMNVLLLLTVSWLLAAGIGAIGWFWLQVPLVAFFGLFGVTGLLAYGAYRLAVVTGKELLSRLY